MSHDWKELKLGEILEVKYGKDHKNLLTGTIPVYGSGGIMRHVNTYMYDDESILIPRKGTLSNIFYRSEPFWTVDTMFWTKINKSKVVPKFLYYQLRTIDFTILNVGSAVPSLTVPVINDIDILLPSLPEQESIAEILSSLDYKIDLLHQQNKTLEALAETLFRQWFVEEAEDSWEKSTLSELVKMIDNRGKTPLFTEAKTDYPIIEVNALNGDSRCIDYKVIKKYVDKETYETWFRSGHPKINDILISTVGSIGQMSMLLEEKGSIAQNIVAMRPSSISPYYLYQYLLSIQDEIIEYDIGSVQPSIKVTHLTKIIVPIPNKIKLDLFDKHLTGFCHKIASNYKQINQLETLRDTLLPKLMSGAVRVN
jgi:type I restriction enzyme S subunit